MLPSKIRVPKETIPEVLPLFEQLIGGREQIERYDESIRQHGTTPRDPLFLEYCCLRNYLKDNNFKILWFQRATYHCYCLKYCIENSNVVDVDGTILDIPVIDYLADNFSSNESIAILNELGFVSQLPLDVDLVGLIVEIEKSSLDTPEKRPDILLRHGEVDIFIECKRTESKDNPSKDTIQEDVLNAATSQKFREEYYQGSNKHHVLQILLPHVVDYMTNSKMRALLQEANRRAIGIGDRSDYISSVVATYYTFQKFEGRRTTRFGPRFVETPSEDTGFRLGIQSPIKESIESNPVFDIAGVAE